MTNLLCGHWTFYGSQQFVARCDLPQGHTGMHRYWTNPDRGESFLWADVAERHEHTKADAEDRSVKGRTL